jgi:hypothetical protein
MNPLQIISIYYILSILYLLIYLNKLMVPFNNLSTNLKLSYKLIFILIISPFFLPVQVYGQLKRFVMWIKLTRIKFKILFSSENSLKNLMDYISNENK